MESIIVVDNKIKYPVIKNNNKAPIKVLWFTTSPSLSRSKLDGSYNVGTSWIEAMEALIHQAKNVELAIAFVWNGEKKVSSFTIEDTPTRYYAMPRRPIGKVANFVRRFFCQSEPNETIKDCLEVVNDFKPDVINFFGSENPFPQIIPLIDIPNVIWFQGNLTVYQKKWYSGITKWQSIMTESLLDLLLARSDMHSFATHARFVKREQEIFNNSQNIIGRTEWDKRLVSTMAPQATYHHCEEVIRDAFYQYEWHPKSHRNRVVIVSTFRDNLYKGLETAMEAFKILKKVSPKNIEWRIIGVPEGSHYHKVCLKVSKLKDQTGFKILGARPAQDIISEILAADIFVHPSHIDNSPNSLCEAMMLGIPIVSTNVGGIPSMIKEDEEGLLVQDGDPYAMAGAILSLIKDENRSVELAGRARKRAHQRHNRTEILSRVLTIYSQIIQSAKTPKQ
ncbi:MAG: glycosyltransferase family 4 protein [Saprospiraceae bacterium]|nr:glycosyltransferase family 4 protein [Saprospiraceae bacterium]